MSRLLKVIKELSRNTRFVSIEPIHKGWSCDRKYCARTANGTKYLLRITPREKSASRADMFRMQQKAAVLDIPMCKPIEFGACEEGVYTVQTWIDGEDAENVIPALPDTEQYVYGLEAGRTLRKIHSIPAPETQEDWESRFNRKFPNPPNITLEERNGKQNQVCAVVF